MEARARFGGDTSKIQDKTWKAHFERSPLVIPNLKMILAHDLKLIGTYIIYSLQDLVCRSSPSHTQPTSLHLRTVCFIDATISDVFQLCLPLQGPAWSSRSVSLAQNKYIMTQRQSQGYLRCCPRPPVVEYVVQANQGR